MSSNNYSNKTLFVIMLLVFTACCFLFEPLPDIVRLICPAAISIIVFLYLLINRN